MRFKLVLEAIENNVIPASYQYELESWIYRTINRADGEFATWLHEKGFSFAGRTFKFFNFSWLRLPKFETFRDRIRILGNQVDLEIAFHLEKIAEPFLVGLFQNQQFTLGDSVSQVKFEVRSVETLEEVVFGSQEVFQCISPVCVSIVSSEYSTATYISPLHPLYESKLRENIVTRLGALPNGDSIAKDFPFRFQLLDEPRSKLIRFKSGKAQETFVKGFKYLFSLETSPEVFRLIYDSGIGEKTSMGFGFVKRVERRVGE